MFYGCTTYVHRVKVVSIKIPGVGYCSGVPIKYRGKHLILTASHCIRGKDGTLINNIVLQDLIFKTKAKLLAFDSLLDIAVLTVYKDLQYAYPPVPLSLTSLKFGDIVCAYGSPNIIVNTFCGIVLAECHNLLDSKVNKFGFPVPVGTSGGPIYHLGYLVGIIIRSDSFNSYGVCMEAIASFMDKVIFNENI